MIRSTQNATISTAAKQRTDVTGLLPQVGVRSELYEMVYNTATSQNVEVRDAFDPRPPELTLFPSNAFNGTFE